MSEVTEGSLTTKRLDFLAGLPIVIVLAIFANQLAKLTPILEYVFWAVLLGLVVRNTIGVPERLRRAFRTELFIKIGLVLLGTSINFWVILAIGAKGLIQAILVVSTVFLVAYYVALRLGLDKKLAAVLSAGVSICGVSAAIAVAGAVLAEKKQLAYVVTLVVVFALPSMLLLPLVAKLLTLPDAVAGAWMGGSIDTTPAVVAASTAFSKGATEVATVIKFAQNALIGVVAFLLASYYTLVVEKKSDKKPSPMEIWYRFPKFILGFVATSILATIGIFTEAHLSVIGNLTKWLFAFSFVCIGLETPLGDFKKLGKKPVIAYFVATVYNTVLTFVTAWLLFGGVFPT